MRIDLAIPDPCVVVLVGAAGSGKSTFAARHFAPGEVLSSDAFRARLGHGEADQAVSRRAFGALHAALERRLAAGRTTVVDATNVQATARRDLVRRASAAGAPAIAIVFDLPLAECLANDLPATRAARAARDRRAPMARAAGGPRRRIVRCRRLRCRPPAHVSGPRRFGRPWTWSGGLAYPVRCGSTGPLTRPIRRSGATAAPSRTSNDHDQPELARRHRCPRRRPGGPGRRDDRLRDRSGPGGLGITRLAQLRVGLTVGERHRRSEPVDGASALPTESLAPSASASPTPSPTPVPIAQVTITEFKLDPRVPSTAGDPRFIAFTSDGPGTIKAQLKAISPQGTTHMCLRAGSKDIKCGDQANMTITATTTSARVNWRVSLQGNGMFTPTVELTVTFPAAAPSIKITHARFDGTSFPDTNGVQAIFIPRVNGNARIVASWGGHPFSYEVDATNQTSGTGNQTLTNQGPGVSTNKSIPVTAGETWKVLLENADAGFGTTDMTYQLSWP